MKQIIFTAMILLILSCSQEESINNCGCVEVQERNVTTNVWTGGAWMEQTKWTENGITNRIDGCFSPDELKYMTRQVDKYTRWYVTCSK